MKKELDVAIKAAKESGKILKKYFGKDFGIYKKSDSTPVTDVDRLAEKKIVSIIKIHFPNHNFLGEEFKYEKTNSEFKWIIDPIDGTKHFIRKLPFYGTSIGLEKNGKIILGVIYMPSLGLLGHAALNSGAFVNGKRVKVSEINKIEDSYVTFGDINNVVEMEYIDNLLELTKLAESNRGFADVYGYLMVAQGNVDIFTDTASPWDIAAAKIIIEEAGGKMTDLNGKDTIYSGNALATNGKLHDEVLKILKRK